MLALGRHRSFSRTQTVHSSSAILQQSFLQTYTLKIKQSSRHRSKLSIMFPLVPELGALRPVLCSDIPRIGIVATAGFRYSPVFQWERPYHEKYPEDTFNSYKDLFSKIIQDPQYIVLAAEDRFDPDEAKKSSAKILPDNEAKTPKAGEKVIVGVACWKLEEGSKRVGQFGNITGLCSYYQFHWI